MAPTANLGLGIGWRPHLALLIERHPGIGFVEVIAEDLTATRLPAPLARLKERGMAIIPHGLSLSLGGAEPLDLERVDVLGKLAVRLGAPLASEHIAYVRAGGREAGHLLPLPRTREAVALVAANVRLAQERLPVPLALENIASFLEWPGAALDEADFLADILDRTGAGLLLDVANLFANARNNGYDASRFLDRIPLERLAYVHVAGGVERQGIYHDTHGHAVWPEVLELLTELCARVEVPGVLLERDDHFPPDEVVVAELAAIADAVARGSKRLRRKPAGVPSGVHHDTD
jgi:uncharacterized protein (UPF0276 family)